MELRSVDEAELEDLAELWYYGWRDAHERVVPAELTRLRTLESFRERLPALLPQTRVAGPRGGILGFAILKGDELYQLYVAAGARGTGVAAALLDDAEARLAAGGVESAWLACAIGNDRAARFYEKRGWQRTGTAISRLETGAGSFPLEVWRYEKRLKP
jgi:ribosomal protein S18 acetylase RimI-like enzyme